MLKFVSYQKDLKHFQPKTSQILSTALSTIFSDIFSYLIFDSSLINIEIFSDLYDMVMISIFHFRIHFFFACWYIESTESWKKALQNTLSIQNLFYNLTALKMLLCTSYRFLLDYYCRLFCPLYLKYLKRHGQHLSW